MSFLHLSPFGVVLGTAVLLGAAFLLQRLKVRHRQVLVPTTLFWREAIERSEARKLTERFRHPLAYLLVALILLLLWLALAGPRPADARGTHYLLLVDGGAPMAATTEGDRTLFEVALERAGELAADLPGARRAVVLAGTPTRTLLAPGEPVGMLGDRAAGLEPAAAPSRLAAELLDLIEARRRGADLGFGAGEDLEVLVLGSPDLPVEVPAGLEPTLTIAAVDLGATPGANDAVLALGLAPAASGAWDRVDLTITASATPTVTVGGERRTPTQDPTVRRPAGDGRIDLLVADLQADGSTVRVALPGGDAAPLDDVAELVLPRRDLLGVWLDPALPGPEAALLAAVVAADPGLGAVPADQAQVALLFAPPGPEPTGSGSDLPALLLTESPDGGTPALVARRAPADGAADDQRPAFGPTFEALALGRVGTDLTAGGPSSADPTGPAPAPTLSEELVPGAPRLTLDLRLLAPPYDLAEGRGLPLYLGLGLRWLAGSGELLPYAAAGQDLVTSARDELGLAPRPRRAGAFELGGETLAASLLSPFQPDAGAALPAADPARLPSGGDPDRGTPLLVLALLLLGLEWHLFRTRRIP